MLDGSGNDDRKPQAFTAAEVAGDVRRDVEDKATERTVAADGVL